jgi:hypothetical protein
MCICYKLVATLGILESCQRPWILHMWGSIPVYEGEKGNEFILLTPSQAHRFTRVRQWEGK